MVNNDSKKQSKADELTRTSLIARNTVISILAKVLPLGIGLISIPILIRDLGSDRFGVLTLVWMFISYLALMDLGLGRALTKFVSERIGKGKDHEILELTWTTVFIMGGMGVLLAIAIYFSSPFVVYQLFEVKPELQVETINGLRIMGWVMPVMFMSITFRSVLSAFQEFRVIALAQLLNGVLNYAAPLLVLIWFDRLEAVVGILLINRLAVMSIYTWQFSRQERGFWASWGWYQKHVKELLTFGGWVSVSNVVSPLIDQADRVLLATMFSMTMVAYYTTPMEMILKVSMLPVGIVTVFFPAISTSIAANPQKAINLLSQGLRGTLFVTFPIVLALVLFAREGLLIWIGPEFSANSTILAQILCIGILLKSLSHMPLAYLHSINRPDLTAKIHLGELIGYAVVLYVLTVKFGLVGAAIAHALRIGSDMLFMMFFAVGQMNKMNRYRIIRESVIPVLTLGAILAGTIFIYVLWIKIVLFVLLGSGFLIYGWFFMLNDKMRNLLLKRLSTAK